MAMHLSRRMHTLSIAALRARRHGTTSAQTVRLHDGGWCGKQQVPYAVRRILSTEDAAGEVARRSRRAGPPASPHHEVGVLVLRLVLTTKSACWFSG